MMLAARLAIALAALSLVSAQSPPDCKHANGYKYSKCGKGDSETCCKALQKCITAKTKDGAEKAECSENRQLTNTKAVKVVIAPLFFLLLDIALIAYLVLRCNPKDPTTIVSLVVLGTAWPFLFSQQWPFGAYTMFLATIIAAAAAPSMDCPKMPGWAYRLLWALAIFHIVSFFGPFESFHVPIYGKSKGSNYQLIKNAYDQTGCNSYYNNYFTITATEKMEKNFNPDPTYDGYCTENWLATVQAFGVVQSILWVVLVLASGRTLLSVEVAGSSEVAPFKEN